MHCKTLFQRRFFLKPTQSAMQYQIIACLSTNFHLIKDRISGSSGPQFNLIQKKFSALSMSVPCFHSTASIYIEFSLPIRSLDHLALKCFFKLASHCFFSWCKRSILNCTLQSFPCILQAYSVLLLKLFPFLQMLLSPLQHCFLYEKSAFG